MTDLDLDAIEARANAAMLSPTGQQYDAAVVLSTDVPALVAEVRRLREDNARMVRDLAEYRSPMPICLSVMAPISAAMRLGVSLFDAARDQAARIARGQA